MASNQDFKQINKPINKQIDKQIDKHLDKQFEKYIKDNFSIDIDNSGRHFFHLCSKGTKRDDLFHNEKEFIMGMNIVACTAADCNVEILAFCLMTNHFHFILSGKGKDIIQFKTRVYRSYMLKRAAMRKYIQLEPIEWGIFLIHNADYLKHSIAYVINNPIEAFYEKLPMYYPWSSASLYFKDYFYDRTQSAPFIKVKDLSSRDTKKLLGSHLQLPMKWYLTRLGYVWPGCYVNVQLVEYLFKDVRSFMWNLTRTNESNQAAIITQKAFGEYV